MIQIDDLVFARGSQIVLDHINLDVQRGEIVSVMGPSGCGKTTLLRCLSGLEQPQSGRILAAIASEGEPPVEVSQLSEADLIEYRRHVGLVFQYAALFDSLSVFENVAFPIHRFRPALSEKEVAAEVHRLLEAVGLAPAQVTWKMPAELSGGMRKRVGLARALAVEPQVILYDEPSSGLDPVSAAHIDRLILEMRERVGLTSVVVSHSVQNVFNTSDRVAMLLAGQVLAFGTPDELRASDDPRVQQFISGSAEGPLSDVED